MTFGAPWALLGLLAAAPVIAAYFLRRRQPPRIVSALFLWRSTQHRAEAGAKLERFSRETSLMLELLAILLAVAYLADVRLGADSSSPLLVVIVDGSFSMQAGAAERARGLIAQRLAAHSNARVTLIESGLRPTMLAGPAAGLADATEALSRWRPSQPSHDLALTFATATEHTHVPRQRILFITDGPPGTPLPENIEMLAVGRPQPNVAFISVHRRDESGHAELTFRIANFGAQPIDTTLRLGLPDGGARVVPLALAVGVPTATRIVLPLGQGQLVASLPDDALPLDGEVTVSLEPEAAVQVGLSGALEPETTQALKRGLSAASGVELRNPAELTFGARDSTATVTIGGTSPLRTFVGPFFAQRDHPLLDDVALGGVLWAAGENPTGIPLLSAGTAVLLSEDEDGRVHFNIDLKRSNLHRTSAWPVFIANLVRSARAQRPGLSKMQLMLGESVPLVVPATARWKLVGPRGVERPIFGAGAISLPPLSMPGRWELRDAEATLGAVDVLPLDPRESDLRDRAELARPSTGAALFAEPKDVHSRPWWLLVGLLLTLLLDFWLTARSKTGWAR